HSGGWRVDGKKRVRSSPLPAGERSDRIVRCDPGEGTIPKSERVERPLTRSLRCASTSTSPLRGEVTASGKRGMRAHRLTSRFLVVAFSQKREATAYSQGKTPMPVQIKQLHPHFVGEVSGVDLRKPLTRKEAEDIEAGMDKYAVLVFHGQDITDEQQMAFALNFGERENPRGGNIVKPQDSRLSTGLNDVSNLGKDGKPLPPDSR